MLGAAWRSAWREPSFRRALAFTAVAAVTITLALPPFFAHIERVHGWTPPDPLLQVMGPSDVGWITFTVLYLSMAFAIARALPHPWLIARGLHAYALMVLLRMLAMWAIVLEPPADIIPLIDPVTRAFYPGGVPFLKDLFFSGHTATMCLMVALSRGRTARVLCLIATVLVAAGVLLQHVHWTVDVLAAPLAAWLAWRGSAVTIRACGWRGA